jgi:hypothetical protein
MKQAFETILATYIHTRTNIPFSYHGNPVWKNFNAIEAAFEADSALLPVLFLHGD